MKDDSMTCDERLRIELTDELRNVPLLAERTIDVDVHLGVVSMTGSVESVDEQMAAYIAAARIVGQDQIAQVVTVRSSPAQSDARWGPDTGNARNDHLDKPDIAFPV